MTDHRLDAALRANVAAVDARGTAKRHERVVVATTPARGADGPRVQLAGEGDQWFLVMSSNSYLGLSLDARLVEAAHRATRRFGVGPGAVRFISGTVAPHVELEDRLARFHGREAAMIFSAAYATSVGVLASLIVPGTAVVSDELNHNCIINAIRLAQPDEKHVYGHNDLNQLAAQLSEAGSARRLLVVTDGVFSMRGDHAPLDRIGSVVAAVDAAHDDGATLVVDDSHGVGAFGPTGRGTEEVTGARADVLIGTLGKAFGVNGGYVVGSHALVDHLRESAPTYIYSNPIGPGEAAAALAAVDIVDSVEGRERLALLARLTDRFRTGLVALGFATVPGHHPVVPLVVGDPTPTKAIEAHLRAAGILATALAYPVVPRGQDEIRFQVNAALTEGDIDRVLDTLARAPR